MLTERQLLILQIIIDEFIQNAHPVGSRSLAKKEKLALSSATIRNEMADLEELGYIEKPHTSSGRVPSEKGYRFYVDHLMSPEKIRKDELEKIQSIFMEQIFELETLIQKSASVLSQLTRYTAIVLGPTVKETCLSRFQIVPLNDETAVAIIVTNTGHIEHKIVHLSGTIDPRDLEKTANILNERLSNVPLVDLQDKLQHEIQALFREHLDNYETLFYAISKLLYFPKTEKVFFGGKLNMLKQPEFQNVEKVQELFSFVEDDEGVYQLLRKSPLGLHVKIGSENNIPAMRNCSLITATYHIGDKKVGTIAILGPKRMRYSRVVSLIEILSDYLSRSLTDLYG
jgi:heat-inducible transcription repressor HrcA